MRKTLITGLFALIMALTGSNFSSAADFKNYAVGLDTSYTLLPVLFYNGYGGGLEGEIGFLGNLSFFLDSGYENLNLWGTNSQIITGYAGFRYYLTYDAVAGAWVGLGVGLGSTQWYSYNNTSGQSLSFNVLLELGYKYILDRSTGFFIEPVGKMGIEPQLNVVYGIYSYFFVRIGADVGFSF